ncbi:hypothetical protein RJ55_04709 [Drechmeria coniospora]|nr:hypothetical protein RJ55_04709 [Drechmeria coniospora]
MSPTHHALSAAPHRHARVLACVLCQQRKIKCDRNFPCANCVKANVTCTPSTPAPARKRRRPNQDLQERLMRCEELLKQYAGAVTVGRSPSPATPTTSESRAEPSDLTPATTASPQQSWRSGCKMISEDGSVRFMDSYIWGSISEELQAMRDIVETEDPEDSSILGSDDLTPDNNTDLFFPGDLSTANLDDLTPDPVHGFRLWQIFLDRVNPLTKVIHVPTVQPFVMEAASGMSSLPLHVQALLFSIYAMAVLSLTESESIQMLGLSREAAMQKFTAATKVALIRFNFLKNYNMVALQALVLFLFSLQGRYDRHAAWILSGTVVRIAQKMGYHRDGETLGLDPFETEMRRRVWWQIAIQDSKYAMMSGLSQSLLPTACDTKLPQNVNDADIFPGSTEPVRPREGPTEMAFCLLLNEVYKFKISSDQSFDGPSFEAAIMGQDLDPDGDASGARQTLFNNFRVLAEGLERRLMDLETKYVDVHAGDVHLAALTIRPMVTNKLSEMLVPMREQPEWGTEIFGPKDKLFKVVVMGSEHKIDAFERLKDTGFLWFMKLHFQLDIFAVMTGQLCQRPTGSLADRGWAVIERVYGSYTELSDMSQKQYNVQAHFVLKAWKARENALRQAGQTTTTPALIARLRELLQPFESRSSGPSSATPPMPTLPLHHHQQPHGQHPNVKMESAGSMPFDPAGTDVDPFLGGYLDMPALNWDMFGMSDSADQLSAAMFGSIGLGNVSNIGAVNNMRNPNSY